MSADMETWNGLLILGVVHLFAAISPGPTFLLVSRTALISGRQAGVASALACGFGVLPWAIGAMLGLALLLKQAQWLYSGLKIAGGLYLIYLAVLVWRHAPDPIASGGAAPVLSSARAFSETFFAQLANPKVAVFFGAIFVSVLPPDPPLWLIGAILLIVFLNEAVWYGLVALLFSAEGPRAAYLYAKPWVDRIMAALLGALGLKLLIDARNT
jgi:threonine/homoserine/homoserine lactone efflux protein